MNIYKCGSLVTIKLNNMEATITGVSIKFSAVLYELSYFNNNKQEQVWMNEVEFTPSKHSKQKIGFITS